MVETLARAVRLRARQTGAGAAAAAGRAGGGGGRGRRHRVLLVHGPDERARRTGAEQGRRVGRQHLVQLLLVLPVLGAPVLEPNLDARLVELGGARELLATVDVRVVALREGRLELLQLVLHERGSVAPPRGRARPARLLLLARGRARLPALRAAADGQREELLLLLRLEVGVALPAARGAAAQRRGPLGLQTLVGRGHLFAERILLALAGSDLSRGSALHLLSSAHRALVVILSALAGRATLRLLVLVAVLPAMYLDLLTVVCK